MALTSLERTRRYRAKKKGRSDRIVNLEIQRLKAEGKTVNGWLVDDGIVDMIAVHLIVSGDRVPEVTRYEAVVAAKMLLDEAKRKKISGKNLVKDRLGCSPGTAESLLNAVRDPRPGKGLNRVDG